MNDLITIFNMAQLPVNTRINILYKLKEVINHQYSANVVDELVFELIDVLRGQEIPNLHYQVCEDCKGKCRGHY